MGAMWAQLLATGGTDMGRGGFWASSVLGAIAAVVILNLGYSGWLAFAGFFLIGGLGWSLIWWVLTHTIFHRPQEFVTAWQERAGPSWPPKELMAEWRRDRRSSRIAASDWLDRRYAEVQRQAHPEHTADIGGAVVSFWRDGDGRVNTKVDGPPDHALLAMNGAIPADPSLHNFYMMEVDLEMTKWQLATGQEPHYDYLVPRARAEMEGQPDPLDPLDPPEGEGDRSHPL